MNNWYVTRWGGNSNHKKKRIFEGDELTSREKFISEFSKMRQGSVELFDSNDVLIDKKIAFRNRTRW